ncbi:carbohydrate kinase family protein [Micromonospora yasonensis]|uniref:carbohydrate kinase family protein n=1 Tax=Micromonospora yasonensis TaxID=1128667 RepID=UPI00222E4614|nr:carbohydrate kinase family protein [Micromonospora yasonensis]MCW3842760.1 carbohydrate kinase family protein [Micromonospora yasonensis]
MSTPIRGWQAHRPRPGDARYAVFFGDVAMDEYYRAPHFPVAGDKIIVRPLEPQFGGMVANSAAIFANYGVPTSFMSQLNSGELTQRLLSQLEAVGLDTHFVILDEEVPDSRCIILLADDQHIVLIPTLGITHTEITPAAFEHMAGAAYLVTTVTDATPFRMGERGAGEVLAGVRAAGTKIVMDLDVYNLENHPSPLIDHCDIVFMNAIGYQRFSDCGQSIQAMLDRGALAVIVTNDSAGCRVFTEGDQFSVAGHRVDVVDVTGAGDTFTSSFLYSYLVSDDLRYAAEFANAAAALSVGKVGARGGMLDEATVLDFMARSGRLSAVHQPSTT